MTYPTLHIHLTSILSSYVEGRVGSTLCIRSAVDPGNTKYMSVLSILV